MDLLFSAYIPYTPGERHTHDVFSHMSSPVIFITLLLCAVFIGWFFRKQR